MSIIVVTPPATEPVSVAEAKVALRVDGTTEDQFIGALIKAARESVEALAGVSLITRRFMERHRPRECNAVSLWSRPITTVHAVRCINGAGVVTAIDPAHWMLSTVEARAAIRWKSPSLPLNDFAYIEVEGDSGFGAVATAAPQALRDAVLMLVAHRYADRESSNYPAGFGALLAPYREMRL